MAWVYISEALRTWQFDSPLCAFPPLCFPTCRMMMTMGAASQGFHEDSGRKPHHHDHYYIASTPQKPAHSMCSGLLGCCHLRLVSVIGRVGLRNKGEFREESRFKRRKHSLWRETLYCAWSFSSGLLQPFYPPPSTPIKHTHTFLLWIKSAIHRDTLETCFSEKSLRWITFLSWVREGIREHFKSYPGLHAIFGAIVPTSLKCNSSWTSICNHVQSCHCEAECCKNFHLWTFPVASLTWQIPV